ncbi:MAG: hypothetical protein HOP96_06805 [Sphingomonas sp.]|nr:hypothetical protein [Sphingomonas sp.]
MDVTAMRIMRSSPAQVAAVMFDPYRDPEWIGGAKSLDPPTGDPTAEGARVTRHGGFMGKKFSWTTEVVEHVPQRLLRMRFVEGPMKGGGVTYSIESSGGHSRVSIRNTGPGPSVMGWFVKRSVGKDLDRLAKLIER